MRFIRPDQVKSADVVAEPSVDKEVLVPVEVADVAPEAVEVAPVVESAPVVEEPVKVEEEASVPTEAVEAPSEVVEEAELAKEDLEVVEPSVEEEVSEPAMTLEEKFAIPEFKSSVVSANAEPENPVVKEVEPPLVSEVVEPQDAVKDSDEVVEPSKESIPEVEERVEEDDEVVDSEESKKGFADAAWDKFVDNVIIPTLCTCIDNLKKFVVETLASDLKVSKK